ncbi:ATP-binding protein [Lentzea sp. NPDC055074]
MEPGSDELPPFAGLLLRHRHSAGLTQEQLARASGVSARALRELERGRARAAQRRSAEALADVFGLTGAERDTFLGTAEEGRRRPGEPLATLAPAPRDVAGRGAEFELLRALLADGHDVAVVGPAGVGKTVMVAFAAERLREEFPDGCFAVDLRGMDERPLEVTAVFDRLLRALGVPAAEIPVAAEDQAVRYRTVLSAKRALVVLDNASAESQVRPFLGLGSGSRTLVTCRRTLAGLASVRWLPLDPLRDAEARDLLAAITDDERIAAEPEAARELGELCGNLPLALRIAGDLLATRPDWTVARLVDGLRDERTRLSALSAGDLQVRSAFDLSYRALTPPARTAFCRLAALPGADFGIELVRVAADLGETEAFRAVDELIEASVLQDAPAEGRFRFHDLLRLFAGQRWEAESAPGEREHVTGAVLEHLLGRAAEAAAMFFPEQPADSAFGSVEDARTWLDEEESNWIAALRLAAQEGMHGDVVRTTAAMHWYSDDTWNRLPWESLFRSGACAARELGDVVAEAKLLNFLGWALGVTARPREALEVHERALRLAEDADDRRERMWALSYCGWLYKGLGDGATALSMIERAAELSAGLDHWSEQLPVRHLHGQALLALDRVEEALEVQNTLREDAERHVHGDPTAFQRRALIFVSEGLAQVLQRLERWPDAAVAYGRCRDQYERIGSTSLAGRVAYAEGRCWAKAGDRDRAERALRYALDAYGDHDEAGAQREEVLTQLASLA